MDVIESFAELMNLLPEVRWDRCIIMETRGTVYGWVDREDGKADFVLLRWEMQTGVWFTTSSARYSEEFSRRIFGDRGQGHVFCERIEDVFGDKVKNVIKLEGK